MRKLFKVLGAMLSHIGGGSSTPTTASTSPEQGINPKFFSQKGPGLWVMHTDAIRLVIPPEYAELSETEKQLVVMLRERPYLGEMYLALGKTLRNNDEVCREFMDSIH